MFIFELFEDAPTKHVAFCFGRMNPPTVGHKQLLDTVAQAAEGSDYFIFVSHSQDPKKNPLDPDTKIAFLQKMFPDHAKHIVDRSGLTTVLFAASMLYDSGYNAITFVAGSDRLDSMGKLLKDYNGIEGKTHGYYRFDSINLVSSGDRDPDADGLGGVSASRAREAAATGDIEAFAQATGAGELAPELFKAVRAGMNIKEDAAGVGVVANKKQAQDPRYSMSLTQDIRPGETDRQLRKMHLK